MRLLMVIVSCGLLANCAVRPAPELLSQSSVSPDAWEREAAERKPVRRTPRQVSQAEAPKPAEPATTGSTAVSSAARSDIRPLSPESHAAENAEAERLKRLTNICRC
jgi:hypothetical protein